MQRTGIKILYYKLRNYIKFPNTYFDAIGDTIPNNGISNLKFRIWLHTIVNELKDNKFNQVLGSSHSTPDKKVIKVWTKLLKYNPNNLGNWTLHDKKSLNDTKLAENNLINQLINLYGGDTDVWTGYVTTGATESNIFSAWVGRNYFSGLKNKHKSVLIYNDLTHYSVIKAADVLNIQTAKTALNKNWITDRPGLVQLINKLSKKGFKNILLPLTLGYTQTGTNDDLRNLSSFVDKLQKKYNVTMFIWLDAAANGLVLPFIKKQFKPLKNAYINSIIVDFHKTGMCPIPSGVVIFKKQLINGVARVIPYTTDRDVTLLGSRSGVAAAGMLALLNSKGMHGIKNDISNCLKSKNKFIKEIVLNFPSDIKIVNENSSTSLGISSEYKLADTLLEKYGLYSIKKDYLFTNGIKTLYVYKATFFK